MINSEIAEVIKSRLQMVGFYNVNIKTAASGSVYLNYFDGERRVTLFRISNHSGGFYPSIVTRKKDIDNNIAFNIRNAVTFISRVLKLNKKFDQFGINSDFDCNELREDFIKNDKSVRKVRLIRARRKV